MEALLKIQSELKAPKNQLNKFGGYNYRSCEDILEAVKPLLVKHGCTLTIHDEVKQLGSILFIEATASIQRGDEGRSVTAQAGINPERKGMDIAQSFGASSSYARKYALNGLFLIDDTKDPDATNTHDSEPKNKPQQVEDSRPWLNKGEALNKTMEYLRSGGTIAEIEKKYRLSSEIRKSLELIVNNLKP
jgi:aminoglycoside N3'-acetyltransferase